MKKLFLAAIMIATAGLTAGAQEANINFESGSWSQIIETAKAANRVIFLDCYTDWCDPCRHVAQNVFTQPEVADFFNANFVNAKIEMEKDPDGPALVKKYDVEAYPSFLFIDPHTEDLLYVKLGSGQGLEWLIDVGRLALDPSLNKAGMELRYRAGERDFDLEKNYIKLLDGLSMKDEQAEVTDEWLDSRTGDDFFTEQTWEIITLSMIDPLSSHFPVIVRERQIFYDIAGTEAVDKYLGNAIQSAIKAIVLHIWEPAAFGEVCDAAARHAALIDVYKTMDYPAVETPLVFLETALYARNHQWKKMLRKMKAVDASGMLADREEYDYWRYNLTPFARSRKDDLKQFERALEMVTRKSATFEGSRQEHQYLDLRNQLKYRNE